MSRLLTWILGGLPLLGVVLTLVGLGAFGRLPAGWDTSGFLVNLASSVTAACFGLPLAFFVLQKLLFEREEVRRRRGLADGAARAIGRLRESLAGPCTFGYVDSSVIAGAEETLTACLLSIRKMKVGLENDPSFLQTSTFRDLGDDAAARVEKLGEILFLADSRAPDRSMQIVDYLKDDVSSSLLREGWASMPADLLNQLSDYLSWIDDRASPVRFEEPPSFDRLSEFAHRDWPIVREKSYRPQPTQPVKNFLQEARRAAEEARGDLSRARTSLVALRGLEEHMPLVGR